MNTPLVFVNKTQIAKRFSVAANRYEEAAIVQKHVGEAIIKRLDFIKMTPQRILDAGTSTGRFARALSSKYPKSRVVGLDIASGMVAHAKAMSKRFFPKEHFVCADVEQMPFSDKQFDLVFSNFMLQWCPNLPKAFRECLRVLNPRGLLMFSTVGPDTLTELRQSWHQVDEHAHVNVFLDMHDVGDALLSAGFSDPVMDVEHYTVTYQSVKDILIDLKTIGSHVASPQRSSGLFTRSHLAKLTEAYEAFRTPDGLYPLTYEVVYGHAWRPETDPIKNPPGEYRVSVEDIKRREQS